MIVLIGTPRVAHGSTASCGGTSRGTIIVMIIIAVVGVITTVGVALAVSLVALIAP